MPARKKGRANDKLPDRVADADIKTVITTDALERDVRDEAGFTLTEVMESQIEHCEVVDDSRLEKDM